MTTLFRSATSTAPASSDDLDFDALEVEIAALCSQESTATHKRDLPALGPYRLRDGTTRAAENVERMDACVMLDCDGIDAEALCTRIEALGLDAIVHGSPGDDENAPVRKVRVFVRAEGEHDPADAGRVRAATAALLGVQDDPRTHNADRIGFVGRLAGTPERVVWRNRGRALTFAELPPVAVLPAEAPAPAPIAARADAALDAGAYAIVGTLGAPERWEGSKHALCGALGGLLRRHGWPRDTAASAVRVWLLAHPDAGKGVDVEAGVAWACKAWEREPHEVSGRQALDAIVGAELGAILQQAAELPRLAKREARTSPAVLAVRDAEIDGLAYGTLSDTPTRQRYVIPELEVCVGRAFGWLGKSNASKTISLMQLEVDAALGRDVFGRFAITDAMRVLHIAYEGFAKLEEDYARLLRGALGKGVQWDRVRNVLHFAEGRRWLTGDPEANREWLLRVCEPYAGGLVVIDPLVAACMGLDENSTEISRPIYDCEHVAKTHDIAIIIAHHLGHAAQRSRGSSAIEGAFGASVILSKVDGKRNIRHVEQHKRNRYGADPFDLEIVDTNEDGTPWKPSREARRAGVVSWAVAVRALDAAAPAPSARREDTVARKAQAIRDALADASSGVQQRMSASAARALAGVSGKDWPDVLEAAKRMGVRVEAIGRRVELCLASQAPRPAGFR